MKDGQAEKASGGNMSLMRFISAKTLCALRYAGLACALAALALLPGCEKNNTNATEIRFWNGFTGPDGRTMRGLVSQFNKENPDINVVMQRMDWSTFYNKLFVAGIGGRSPEVVVIHTDVLYRFIKAGFLRPIDDLIVDPVNGFDLKLIDEVPLKGAQVDGHQYALPLDVHPLGLFYNKDVLKKAGYVDAQGNAKPPATRDEFMDMMRKLKVDANHDGHPEQWGTCIGRTHEIVLTMMRQFGGMPFSPDLKKCTLNSPENVAALQFIIDLVLKDHLAPRLDEYDYFDSWLQFRQGHIAMAMDGIYMLGDLKRETQLPYAGAPVPQFGKQMAVAAGSHNLTITSACAPEKVKAAWKFIRFLSDHSLTWADAGQVPVRLDLRSRPEFQKMSVQANFAREIPHVFYLGHVSFVVEFTAELDLAIEKAMRGRATPKEALDVATANIQAVIDREIREDALMKQKAQKRARLEQKGKP